MSKPLEKIVKEYPSRGPLCQFRFENSISFKCFRCGQSKISKLITIYNKSWNRRLCNGCYGRLLSIYAIKTGKQEVDLKVDELSELLVKLIDFNSVREQSERIIVKQNQANFLSALSLKFFATAECVANSLLNEPNLDWSPAVIGICKSFELEIFKLLINPLKDFSKCIVFTENDLKDPDFGKVASYCSGKSIKAPELGVINHFLRTAVNSNDRINKSPFLRECVKPFISKRPNASWILDHNGLLSAIDNLTKNFRNKAAHTDELSKFDYENCKELVYGDKGIMWKLILSTEKP